MNEDRTIIRSLLPTFLTAALCASANAATLEGSVHVPGKHDVRGTWVVSCDLDARGDCVSGSQVTQQITRQDGSSAWFKFENAPTAPRGLVAWKDVNGNATLDVGDLYGAYTIDGTTLAKVRAPYEGAVIWMREMDGVADPFLSGEASAAPNAPAKFARASGDLDVTPRGAGRLTGTVIAPLGYDVKGVVVLACRFKTDDCYAASRVNLAGRHARWRVDGLADEGHQLLAWADINGNGEVDEADLMGTYLNSARDDFQLVKPGAGNITLSLAPMAELAAASKPSAKRPAASDAIFKNTSVANLAGRWTTRNRVSRLSQGFTSGVVFGGATVQAGWDWTPTQLKQDVDLLIRPDGSFRSVTFTQDFQSESCATLTTVERVGKVVVTGAKLSFQVTRAAFREVDTCQPSFNRWGALKPSTETDLAGVQKGPNGGLELVLRPGGSSGDLFFRKE
ncbi:hypothetical protein [Deinococcus yavapaiensis]|uniref:EF-hand domain-containing protein n=1 Tax=Deinococcus yavapaiensis KR-236 TaxID=694435 RepID=A0A318SLM1_9DEIO|nr:hypothetical protein [Deinococcus yavapaiensis]PYE55429.1 hypothetical protein DES52_103262 [Deinococcus yavapaiensis KR-236]